jgi:hypothetical protein
MAQDAEGDEWSQACVAFDENAEVFGGVTTAGTLAEEPGAVIGARDAHFPGPARQALWVLRGGSTAPTMLGAVGFGNVGLLHLDATKDSLFWANKRDDCRRRARGRRTTRQGRHRDRLRAHAPGPWRTCFLAALGTSSVPSAARGASRPTRAQETAPMAACRRARF